MYERLLDKNTEPTAEQVKDHLGGESFRRLLALEEYLQARYQWTKAMRFPFGNSYGWGYKYGHKAAHLCYAFFEAGAFTVTIQIGDRQAPLLEEAIGGLSPKARALWADRYPCGDHGGWVHYRVLGDEDLADIYRFIQIKKKPA